MTVRGRTAGFPHGRFQGALFGGFLLPILLAAGCGEPGFGDGADAASSPATLLHKAPVPDAYRGVVERTVALIDHEIESKHLSALSVALVDGPELIWAEGFGWQDPDAGVPASATTVYRVGSISKLFTDMGVMQLVERGELDLDDPVSQVLPEFQPRNPHPRPITLRQLMSHRSGLVREPPVGHYFDTSEPSLAETVASLNGTTLVYEPQSRVKYSNAAIATVGYVLEVKGGESFAPYMERALLRPMGLESSSFEPRPDLRRRLAKAYMWGYDGRVFEAPCFELGMAPAGSMYSTVTDLGRFLSVLLAGGEGPEGPVLSRESLEQMWTPQFGEGGERTGAGLGFFISELEGHRMVRHGGAIYGFATELAALPEEGLGVAVATALDGANAVTGRIALAALRWMLEARAGEPLREVALPTALAPEVAERLEGRYGAGEEVVDLLELGGRLFMEPLRGGVRVELRTLGDTLVIDSPLQFGTRLLPTGGGLRVSGRMLEAREAPRPSPPPERWRRLVGEYGWGHNILYILEKEGQLFALIEWFFLDRLEELSPDEFAFPRGRGLYEGERLVFHRDERGAVTGVAAGGILFPRREVGTDAGVTFRITPVRPADELRREALAAQPPREEGDFLGPDLTELVRLDPTLKLDIRYAGVDNFMAAVFYEEARAFLQKPAAEALVRAHRSLESRGYGLLIHDGYRPWYVTKMFWDATPDSQKIFVADPARGSRHNRGAAVDLTLYDLSTGEPVGMVGGYDEFSDRSFADYPGGTSLQRWLRELLREAMEEQGYTVYPWEWWHFDYKDWSRYRIQNVTFGEIR